MSLKKNGLKIITSAGLLALVTIPYAEAKLPVGTDFYYNDFLNVNQTISSSGIKSISFTHQLDNADFWPILEGGEVLDIQNSGQVIFEWMIKPLTPLTIRAYLDGILIGQQTFRTKDFFEIWEINLPVTAYDALEDRTGVCTIEIADGKGSLSVSSSTLGGAGVVVPEPASMLLLMGGLLCLCGKKNKKD